MATTRILFELGPGLPALLKEALMIPSPPGAIAKEYSTPQSGQFVNGILDNIHKDLLAQNKLDKVSYKKPG